MSSNSHDWVCSRFYGDKSKGILKSSDIWNLIQQCRRFQVHGLYFMPAFAVGFLFVGWVTFRLSRNRRDTPTFVCKIILWISTAVGFTAALTPMMLGNTLTIVGPIYHSETQTRFSMGGLVLMWTALGFQLAFILTSVWYHHRIGGVGNYESTWG